MHPILFSVGRVDILSAPVFAGLSALLAYLYVEARRKPLDLPAEDYWNIMLCLAVGVIVGGALVYLAVGGRGPVENIRYALRSRRVIGGAFFGSFWGAFLLAWLYCRARKLPFLPLADVVAPASLLALAVMRVGCLLHGCCHGAPTAWGWGLVFTDPRGRIPSHWLGVPLHPVQLYESAGSLALFLVMDRFVLARSRAGRGSPGDAFIASVASYAVMRFLLEFLKGTDRGVLAYRWLTTGHWLAAASICVALAAWLLRGRGLAGAAPAAPRARA